MDVHPRGVGLLHQQVAVSLTKTRFIGAPLRGTIQEYLDRFGAEVEAAEFPAKHLRDLTNDELRAVMYAEAAAEAETEDDGAPLPPHVKVSRPNRGARSVADSGC